MSNVEVGANIRRIRESKGISVKELAIKARMGMSKIYITELGRQDIKVNDLCHIADALGCWVGEFLEEGSGSAR